MILNGTPALTENKEIKVLIITSIATLERSRKKSETSYLT